MTARLVVDPGAGPPGEASLATEGLDRYRRGHARGRALAELCRLQIARVPCLVLVAAGLATGSGLRPLLAGVALVLASCALAAALNDRADIVSDRLNGRTERPLASGALSSADLRAVVGASSMLVLVTQAALPQPTGLLVAMAAATVAWASACEPLALQRRGLAGLVALAMGYLVLPVALAVGLARAGAVAPLALLGAGVLAHKDVRDEVGDRAAGKRTLLVRGGYGHMAAVAVLVALAGVAGCWVSLGPGPWVTPGAVAVVALAAMARRGHTPAAWTVARLALVSTTICAAVQVGAGGPA